MRKWAITALVIAALAALAATAEKWLPPFLAFLGANKDLIQTLSDLMQLVLWGGAGALLFFRLWRAKTPAPQQSLLGARPHSKPIADADGMRAGGNKREEDRFGRDHQPSNLRDSALRQLPSPPSDFTGRAEELADLLANLGRGGVHISGLHGMGGVGKTTLALKLAEQLAPRYPDAQFYLDLKGASAQPLSAADAMLHVIRAYDLTARPPDNEAELRARYLSVLHGQRALLLMDNAASREQVEPLVPPETCLLIVTSRKHFMLPGLFDKDLDTLPHEDARKLLLKIAPRIGDEADELAHLCGHLPLALRLAASALAELRDLKASDYVRRLSDAKQRLKLIDASLALSYDLLSPELQKLWRTLAVFPDTFDARAAAAVWQLEQDATQDALSELVRYSMLEWDEATTRYNLHDLARLFADARLSEEERSAGQRCHAAHYVSVLREAKKLYKQGGDVLMRGLALFDLEWVNIQAGQSWAEKQAGEDDTAGSLCSDYPTAGLYLLHLRQHPRERIRWLEAALTAARRLKNRRAEGVNLGNLGVAYFEVGEVRRAIEFYEQALVIAREIGERRGEWYVLGNMGNAYAALNETRRAIELYEQVLKIAREMNDHYSEGNALGNLGNAYRRLGEVHRAIEFYEQVLNIARQMGDRRSEANAMSGLGVAHENLGAPRRAIEFYEQQLAITREIGDHRGEGGALWNMSLSFDKLGERDKAIAYAEESLKIREEIEDPWADKVREKLAEWRGEA